MTVLTASIVKDRLNKIKYEIEKTAIDCGRSQEEITLLAVSKTFPAESVNLYLNEGQKDFGESYIQEAKNKIPLVNDRLLDNSLKPKWHLIGHLQSNKAKYAVDFFDVVHSLDSLNLAKALDQKAKEKNKTMEIYIQVNVAGEEQKSGIEPEHLSELLDNIKSLDNLNITGLMTIPPFDPDPEKSRPHFRALKKLATYFKLPKLSMGMSGDFKVAIEEGATIIRVGTTLFGLRQYNQ